MNSEKMPISERKEIPPNIEEISPEDVEMRELFDAEFSASTETSPEHPDRNEDAFFIDAENAVAGVFDGVGGAKAGNIASEMAAGAVLAELKNAPENMPAGDWERYMKNALLKAGRKIVDAIQKNPESTEGMGTTATAVKFLETPAGKKAVIGNAGDSRAYLFRNGKLSRITKDDSVLQYLIDKGMVANDEDLEKTVKLDIGKGPTEYAVGEIRNQISMALGVGETAHQKIEPRAQTIDVFPGDIFILSSDGIHDNLTDKEIEDILKEGTDIDDRLVRRAALTEINKSNPRHKPDDKTAAVIKID